MLDSQTSHLLNQKGLEYISLRNSAKEHPRIKALERYLQNSNTVQWEDLKETPEFGSHCAF